MRIYYRMAYIDMLERSPESQSYLKAVVIEMGYLHCSGPIE
jgi:hypothetical protein